MRIAILGSGSWGTALSMLLVDNGHDVVLYTNMKEQVEEINQQHTNQHYLPDTVLDDKIYATTDLKEAVEGADMVWFVLPTKAIRSVATAVAPLLKKKPILVHASKGLEQGSRLRISQVIEEVIPSERYEAIVVLSGPSHAEEVAVKDITTITAASRNQKAAEAVQAVCMNDYFRVYTNPDVIGVEIGAATKNIIAVGAGVLAGLGYGDNAKAALITRGLTEINRLGRVFGADPLTFIGLSGVGDLIVTCTSHHSRNWRAGYQLGQGKSLEEVLDHMGMVVEGVATIKVVYELGQELDVDLPITNALYGVLYHGEEIHSSIRQLMRRDPKSEVFES
ncbi:NAD(P)H-dependent glycerol-3-phosphate dehydrogenase [Atopobacter sp. AH10]|uniref:NAD(P)H-dependent glycerol-3-phosphate dehydrogenase n=1 Tax=Atopobacter sp. AH10 TaxID=2315861 RepID=UPI000EF22989|nr:NAD(P)H-dependent glycerol-3-phosphate dehydrogenase [Atopobacter sp. AH10]RLK62550.1 NAD(P)H-dependent glycerol-3-phosphate dehydrogenase [Atopobacter sp. AH10]